MDGTQKYAWIPGSLMRRSGFFIAPRLPEVLAKAARTGFICALVLVYKCKLRLSVSDFFILRHLMHGLL
jgi:hypothetical protein